MRFSSNLLLAPAATVSLLASTVVGAALPSCEAPTVTVKNGTYSGVYSPSYHQDFFLGIPFAQPPVGDRRFRVPVSYNQSWTGVRNASSYGAVCYGYSSTATLGFESSEDCLTINIVRPAGYEGQDLPVAAWIFGGGYFSGNSAERQYNLSFIVQNSVQMGKPIMAVSMNYRVAGFGFLRSEDLVSEGSTNMGMRDQRLALHWVKENIGAFGGNPDKVTIWGESAGAFSVGYHLMAYGGRDDGLFRGAIAESGNTLPLGHPTWSKSQAYYDNITEIVGCSNVTDTLACLREVPIATLDKAFNTTWQNIFFPQPDGDFLKGSTYSQLVAGEFVKVPFLLGANTDEGTAFVPLPMDTTDDLAAYMKGHGVDNTTLNTLLALYPDIPALGIPDSVTERPDSSVYGQQYKRGCAYNGDYYFIAGRRFNNEQWSLRNVTSYSYRFNTNRYTGAADFTEVTHGTEIPYVFGNTMGVGYSTSPFADMPPSYYETATLMNRMWASFVHELDPNGHGIRGVPEWPVYNAHNGYGQNFVFDANTTNHVEPDTFRGAQIAYLNSVWGSQYHL